MISTHSKNGIPIRLTDERIAHILRIIRVITQKDKQYGKLKYFGKQKKHA